VSYRDRKISRNGKVWQVGTLTYTMGGLAALFCWLLWGDFAWYMKDRSVPQIVQLLLGKYGASDSIVGILLGSLPPALTILVSPVISYKSDRHRGPWGRRIPYLLASIPVVVFAVAGLAFSPKMGGLLHRSLGAHSPGLNGCVVGFIGLFWGLAELAFFTVNAVYGALVNDVVPPEILGRFFAMFRAVSLIAGIIFNYWLLGNADVHSILILLAIGLLYGIGFGLMCMKVKEGAYPPVPPPSSPSSGILLSVGGYFRDCFGNSYYFWFFGAMAMAWTMAGPFNLYAMFFAKSVSMSLGTYGKCIALTYAVSLVIAYPLGALCDRFHPLRVTMASIGFYACVMLWGGIYARDFNTFGIALVAQGVVSGTFLTAASSLSQRLLPRTKFAELNSAGAILASIATALLYPFVGLFLDHAHHTYRYTFYFGFALALMALAGLAVVHSRFLKLGGPSGYVAP
jgi:MFS family permease